MKKATIFTVAVMLLTVIIGAAALAADWRADIQTDTPQRESRDFSDEETFSNSMAAYCGRMMSNSGYGGSYYRGAAQRGDSCH
jgi:hypothetical protein